MYEIFISTIRRKFTYILNNKCILADVFVQKVTIFEKFTFQVYVNVKFMAFELSAPLREFVHKNLI